MGFCNRSGKPVLDWICPPARSVNISMHGQATIHEFQMRLNESHD